MTPEEILAVGDPVRFRPKPNSNPVNGVVVGFEADGSVRLSDPDSRNRCIPIDRILVRHVGPRGGVSWVEAVTGDA